MAYYTTIKNKKGSIQDILYIIIALVVLTIATLIMFKVSDSINTKFQANKWVNATPRAGRAMNSMNDMYPDIIDNSFMLLIVGLCIVAIALATMVRVHPIFFVFFLLLMFIIIFLAGVFSNIYQKMASQPTMTAVANRLTYITYIMQFLPFITGIMGLILAFVMYKTWSSG